MMLQSRSLRLIAIAMAMGLSVYLAFDRFFGAGVPDYAVNIAAAFLGAVITIVVTSILLNAQSAEELEKEKSIGVFQAKLALYQEFTEFLNQIIDDDEIDDDELRALRGWVLKLSLVSNSNTTITIRDFMSQTRAVRGFIWDSLTKEQRDRWFAWYKQDMSITADEDMDDVEIDDEVGYNSAFTSVGRIMCRLKEDLGEKVSTDKDAALGAEVVVEEMLKSR